MNENSANNFLKTKLKTMRWIKGKVLRHFKVDPAWKLMQEITEIEEDQLREKYIFS